ncbi:MAG: family 20 glycosylhydrolase [Clostridium sp.]|nr:family 20 glycosylhydrolase [Clostridium sp.]
MQPTESAEPTTPTETETPEVTEIPEPTPENPAATVEPTQGEPTAEPTDEGIMPANVMPVQANVELQYRIVHLDCGRKYFSKDWIIALMYEAKAAGYNQVQLAFGNKGLRFLLDDMSVNTSVNTYEKQAVTDAIKEGNKAYYNAGEKNELTEAEMDEIFVAADKIGIEIVPLFNTPFHMEAVITAMGKLNITNAYYGGNAACLNLSNDYATAFVKALMQKYITYFRGKGCKYFNFGADEYVGGWNDTFYNYANDVAKMISEAGMTARAFNDSFRYNSNTYISNEYLKDVCYWYTGYSGNLYSGAKTIADSGYNLINTNKDYYYVLDSSKSSEYKLSSGNYNNGNNSWENYAGGFSNTTYNNWNTAVGNGNYTATPAGSMFCIWCDEPGQGTETEVAQQIRMILRVIGARMQNSDIYSASNELVEGGFKADGTINVPTNNKTVGNDNDTVRVTGPNLAALTATEYTEEIAGIKAVDGRIKAYNVTPSTADNNKYTGEAEVRIKITAEWDKTKVKAFIVEDGTAKDIADGKVDGEWYVFTAPHFSVMGIYEQDVTYVEDTVTVVVGSSETVTIEGYDYSEQVGEIDTSIATVKVTYEGVTVSEFTPATSISNNAKYIVKYGDKYIDENGKLTDNISEAAEWTYERYNNTYGKLKNSKDQYLTYQSNGSFTTVQGYNNNSWLYVNGTTVNMHDGSGYNIALSLGTKTEGSSQPSTIITFTGVKEGTTSVVIGGTRYTVKVVDATLAQQVLPINLWITNTGVVPDGWGTSYGNVTREGFTYGLDTEHTNNGWETFRAIYELKATEGSIHSEQGVKLSELIPNKGKAYGYRGSNTPEEYNVDIWKCSYNASAERQSTDGWTNSSNKGTEFEYIRYWENKWEYYSATTGKWIEISEVGAGKDDSAKNQVCVWYRQVTTVTSEVTTEIVDWGPIKYAANQCLLDFAVKYDGTANRIPNSFPVTGKTIGFDIAPIDNVTYYGTDNGAIYRTVYGIAGVETLNYEVYMITVTPTSDTHTDYVTKGTKPTELNYGGTEKIAWAKTEADANSTELNKMPNVKYGGEPFLESVKIYQYQGLLVTYYLRAKQTPDSLTVHYAIQGSETAFYEYNIAVNKGTTFNSGIALDHSQDPYVGGPLLNGRVTNSNGETITVSSNLATLQGLEPQYRYSKYEIVGFRKDDKNVWIYYTFTREYTYVIDFGLPLKIKFSDFGVTNDAAIDTVSLWEKEIVLENKGLYGTAKVITESTEGKYVLYTLDKPLDKNITIPLYVKFKQRVDNDNNKPQRFTANIIPATSVYYEDSFAKFTNGSGAAEGATWAPVYDTNITAENNPYANTAQALEALGNKTNVYGYDPAYDKCTMFSMGSAQKVTVTSDMVTNWTDTSTWPTAQFTFKGTGFDIISLTDNTSGAIFVDVVNKETGKKEKSVFVDNYYGYTYDATNGWQPSTSNKPNALYQIPVIAVRGLDYDEHNVVIKVAYSEYFDHTANKGSYNFWLDAVRVYDPMGKSENTGNTYGQDGEAYPQYIKLRSELAANNGTVGVNGKLLFIDGKENASISEYANYGPNNEVYLANGQAITFKLTGNLDKIAAVQIGAKSPNSNETNKANMVIGDSNKQLSTATEMYYDITTAAVNNGAQLVTVTNTGEAILSLTNLKITYTEKGSVSLGAMNAEEQTASVMAVRALFAPAPVEPEPEPEPEKTFEPERFEASWTKNVMQGRKATLTVKTSEDVEAITVDGQTIRSYRTRTERVGFGRRAKRITYREFTYSMVAQESADFSVTAINAEGTESEAITARLTVKTRPNSMRDMWDWFKGWF